jgi:hypothetical protein
MHSRAQMARPVLLSVDGRDALDGIGYDMLTDRIHVMTGLVKRISIRCANLNLGRREPALLESGKSPWSPLSYLTFMEPCYSFPTIHRLFTS